MRGKGGKRRGYNPQIFWPKTALEKISIDGWYAARRDRESLLATTLSKQCTI